MGQLGAKVSGSVVIFGASGGIGSAIAAALAELGVRTALLYHSNQSAADELAQRIGNGATVHQVDASNARDCKRAIEEVRSMHESIGGLVWAAGPVVNQHLIRETPDEEWSRALAVEAGGFFASVRAVLPAMQELGQGSIVHLGSAGALRWPDRDGLSVVPKAANEALIKGIAKEEGRNGIRANSVLVGVIDAGMFKVLREQGQFPPGWEEETLKMLALKRWGEAHEVANAVVWLLSDQSSYVTGQQISVAGGYGI